MATENTLSQQLLDLLATRNLHPEMLDRSGRPTDAPNAKTFTFDYESASGKNYGTMVIVLDSDNEMKLMYGDNLGRTMEGTDKNEFFDFIQHLSRKATMNRWTHTIADISQLKHTMQGLAAIQEGLFEGYYGNRNISYAGAPTQARLKIKHSQPLGENDARFRHVESLFVETADGECFRLGFRNLSGGRAMLEHVRQGGKPYDIRGCHLTEMVSEIATLSRFNRASAGRVLEGVTQEVVSQAQVYYKQLRENLKRMSTSRGYSKYFESWHPADITEQEELVENIKTLFVEQTIDTRIEQALPLLAKIQQGRDMKEAEIFESWINNLAEGTWNLPETPEQLDKLKTLMASELIVGPDAVNATEQLYDLVGDDELFDRLHALAEQDPRANCWNDTEVINRLAELGIQMPESAEPAAQAAPSPTAPAAPAPVAEGATQQLSVQQLATISDEALDNAYHYGRSNPGNTFGWQANLKSAAYAKQMIDQGVTDIEAISDAIHKGWNVTAQAFVKDPMIFDDSKTMAPEKLQAKLAQREKLMTQQYAQLPEEEKEKDRVVARAMLQAIRGEQGVDEGVVDAVKSGIQRVKQFGKDFKDASKQVWDEEIPKLKQDWQHPIKTAMAESPDPLQRMQEMAGLPVSESRMIDESGETLMHILDRFKHEVAQFEQGADLDDNLYDALYDYYANSGEMPYGTMKARDGDPYEWISERLHQELGLDEGVIGSVLGGIAGGAITKSPIGASMGSAIGNAITNEGSCNMTMEGSYCPEHGLAECGGGMYESRKGDAVLARIKSLALIR